MSEKLFEKNFFWKKNSDKKSLSFPDQKKLTSTSASSITFASPGSFFSFQVFFSSQKMFTCTVSIS